MRRVESGMRVGVISGSGTYTWSGLSEPRADTVDTPYGAVELTVGRSGAVEIVHLSRHGPGHRRLSNHVSHRANIAALVRAGVDCIISATVCGAVVSSVPLGSLLVFDDLYFPSNRLPDGSLCTWHDADGGPERGHWIFDEPFSPDLRAALLSAARSLGVPVGEGCYGHVDGPRFNTRREIAALAELGVTAVSQTAGPEAVLAGEAGVPLAVVGFVTDHANGVADPEPVAALAGRIEQSGSVFAGVIAATVADLGPVSAPGSFYRFESGS
ncbi:MAG TPA: MTAP family purine nucleoside phosphorylase [Acidimicrobiales bacterium]|nr:MTAP family purine nucleoside phosphorylase [Acidimicrobiales bacterium]